MISTLRLAAVAVIILVLVAVQNGALRYFSIEGTVPNLALLVVVAAGIVRGTDYGAGVGLIVLFRALGLGCRHRRLRR